MTDQQLFLVSGIPTVAVLVGILLNFLQGRVVLARFDAINARFDSFEAKMDVLIAKLTRVEFKLGSG